VDIALAPSHEHLPKYHLASTQSNCFRNLVIPKAEDAFEVYANAAANSDPLMKNVFVDVASMVTRNTRPETLELVARRLRQFGLRRVLFASDRAPGGANDAPKDAWEAFRRLPLTEQEFRTVAENVAPYMR
jgi:predicted TIM-barrel fold metal-dependent hydrolase